MIQDSMIGTSELFEKLKAKPWLFGFIPFECSFDTAWTALSASIA